MPVEWISGGCAIRGPGTTWVAWTRSARRTTSTDPAAGSELLGLNTRWAPSPRSIAQTGKEMGQGCATKHNAHWEVGVCCASPRTADYAAVVWEGPAVEPISDTHPERFV